MPPIMFKLNQTYPLVADVISRFSRWLPWWQITIEDLQDSQRRCCSKIFKEADNFSNSESLCCVDASNQVLTQSDLWFGRRCRLKNFMMAAILDI